VNEKLQIVFLSLADENIMKENRSPLQNEPTWLTGGENNMKTQEETQITMLFIG